MTLLQGIFIGAGIAFLLLAICLCITNSFMTSIVLSIIGNALLIAGSINRTFVQKKTGSK